MAVKIAPVEIRPNRWPEKNCCKCGNPTIHRTCIHGRHESEQVPLCIGCARDVKESSIPTREKWEKYDLWNRGVI